MTTFLLIRHADTDFVGSRIAGWMTGVHLTQGGRQQAARLAERLSHAGIQAIYSSPLERAMETAAAIACGTGMEIISRAELGEIQFGEWTGLTFEELDRIPAWRRFNSFRGGTRILGGESMLEVQARIVGELERLGTAHPGQIIGVVSHGDVIKAAIAYYAGISLDLLQRLEISPASVSEVRVHADAPPQIMSVNQSFAAGYP